MQADVAIVGGGVVGLAVALGLRAQGRTALNFFDCPECKKPVYKLDDASNEFTQCECGNLRWRYGKA